MALEGHDLIGIANTGTGKTAAFLIPIITNLIDNPQMTAIVISPTRELAVQINDMARELTRYTNGLKVALLIGGMPTRGQEQVLRSKPRIIVATPGKLAEQLRRRNINPNFVGMVVMDEADRLHDIGFMPQINEIMQYFHRETQILMFSATLPPEIQKLVATYLKNPVKITVGQTSQPISKIKQSVIQTTVAAKNDVLANEINHREGSMIIFVRTKSRADKLARFLFECGHQATRMHGDRTQRQRIKPHR